MSSIFDQARNLLSKASNVVVKPAFQSAQQMVSPLVNTVIQGGQAGSRLISNTLPYKNILPQQSQQTLGITPTYLKTQAPQDVKSYVKGGLTLGGAVANPLSTYTGGLIGSGFQGITNLAQGKPFTTELSKGFGQGAQFTAQLGPIADIAGVATKTIPTVNKLAGGNFFQRILSNLPKEAATGAAFAATEGQNPITGALQFAPYAVLGGVGSKADTKGFSLGQNTMNDLIRAEEILKDPAKFADKQGYFQSPVERDNAISYFGDQAKQDIQRMALKFLPKDKLEKAGGDYNKMIKYLVDLNAKNKLGNFQVGLVGKDNSQPAMTSAGDVLSGYKPGEGMNNPRNATTSPISTQDYLNELVQKQNDAKSNGGVIQGAKVKVGNFLKDIKEKFVDSTAPIEDALSLAEKKNKFQVLPKEDVRLQIDRVLRSKTLASQFAQDNGFVDVIKNAPDINALDQYMIAKQAATVESNGIKTGRNLGKDQQLIQDLAPTYEPLAQSVNQYSRKLLQYSVDSGLIPHGLADQLVQKYPEYVPLNRVFSELEKGNLPQISGKPITSLSKQTVVQKLQGSERQIASPIESLLLKTQDAFNQGERNIAAKQLASYKDLPGFQGVIKELGKGQSALHTFSFLDNGVKRTFETTPEIAAAAKNLNQEQMGLIGKIFSVPTRVLQLGATGLNIPFTITNMVKDEATAFVNSNHAAQTSILNPVNFVKSLFSAVKHDDLYQEMVRNAGGGTSFDIAREAPNLTVNKLRSSANLGSKIKYTVTHPGELLRAVEDTIGRSEEMGRIKNYAGSRDALLKEGRTPQDAQLLAAQAARENTANFARHGTYSRVLNWVIPFFNAGIQGSRQLIKSFETRPAATGAKLAVSLFLPITAAVSWNLSDPKRKAVYQDLQDYEKQNNIIIIPPNPQKDSRGKWNIIKIPISPELANLGNIVRRSLESAQGLDPIKFGEIANNLFTAGTSLDASSPNKLASTFTPQLIKPVVEGVTNTNLYTGNQIVPDYMKQLPVDQQFNSNTPVLAKKIGGLLGVAPLQVENAAGTIGGGLGSQLIGKESPTGNLQRRFNQGAGGKMVDKVFTDGQQYQNIQSQVKALLKQGDTKGASALIQKNRTFMKQGVIADNYLSKVKKLYAVKKKINDNPKVSNTTKQKINDSVDKQIFSLAQQYNKLY